MADKCDRCGEVHTTDALNIYRKGGRVVEKVCAFCDFKVDRWTANGTMGAKPGVPVKTVSRAEDTADADEEMGQCARCDGKFTEHGGVWGGPCPKRGCLGFTDDGEHWEE